MIRLLVHSRDPRLLPALSAALRPEFDIRVEASAERVKELAYSQEADVLVLDFDSDYSDLKKHLGLFDEIETCGLPIVVMSDDKTRSAALELMHRSACDYFRKPPSLMELRVILRRAFEYAQMKKELTSLQGVSPSQPECDQLVGRGPLSQGVYDLIRRVANLDAFILISGESGTGKELVARAIHNLSARSSAPFVPVSCGAIPETLLEAELFGHEKGAYTGTVGSREGCFEQAANGTLFLDEIGELSLNAQVKLLRVLQQREFCKLGGSRMIPLRARVLFATHRNLAQMVEDGEFRSDLYFRVNVMQIKVSALRQRPDEIPLLAHHFLAKYSAEYEKRVEHIHPNAMALLEGYDWPGNIRELENAIARAIILAEGDCVMAQDLPESLNHTEDVVVIDNAPASTNSFEEQTRDYKLRLAHRAIRECNGNKTMAARKLRISRAYLHRLLRDGGEGADSETADECDMAAR
ncbi:MAG TPA: sigma-54 dependent transcriptional regulator [Bryobacteraceae bacterium]|jgi:DNA-binding NtrC family response regulator